MEVVDKVSGLIHIFKVKSVFTFMIDLLKVTKHTLSGVSLHPFQYGDNSHLLDK